MIPLEKPFFTDRTAKLLDSPKKGSIRIVHKTGSESEFHSILQNGLKSSYRLFEEGWLESLKFRLEDYPYNIYFKAPPAYPEEDSLRSDNYWVAVDVDPDKTFVFNGQLRVSKDVNKHDIYRNQVITLTQWMKKRREGIQLQKDNPDCFVMIHPYTAENLLIKKSSLYFGSDLQSTVSDLMTYHRYNSPILERDLWFRTILQKLNYNISIEAFPPLAEFYNSDEWLSRRSSFSNMRVANNLPPFAHCCEYFGCWEILVRQDQIAPRYIVDSSLHRKYRKRWGIKTGLPVSSECFSHLNLPKRWFLAKRKRLDVEELSSRCSYQSFSERFLRSARQDLHWSIDWYHRLHFDNQTFSPAAPMASVGLFANKSQGETSYSQYQGPIKQPSIGISLSS